MSYAHQIADVILWVSLAGFMVSWAAIYWCLQETKRDSRAALRKAEGRP